jgi:NAD dependent epimerase/dehydratase family enzyme
MSWIALDDVIGALYHALMTDGLQGPVNLVAPHPVPNSEFTRTLGQVLHRPTVLPVPAFAARLAFGEMADDLLLASARIEPRRLLATQYSFRCPELAGALRHVLGKVVSS